MIKNVLSELGVLIVNLNVPVTKMKPAIDSMDGVSAVQGTMAPRVNHHAPTDSSEINALLNVIVKMLWIAIM